MSVVSHGGVSDDVGSQADSAGYESTKFVEDRPTTLDVFTTKRSVVRRAIDMDLQAVEAGSVQVSSEKKRDSHLFLSKLRRHATELAALDGMVESNWLGTDGLEREMEIALSYQMKLGEAADRLAYQLQELTVEKSPPPESHSQPRSTPVKTPKLELTKFDGNPLNYQAFKDDFTCSVDARTDLSVVDKFKLLKQSLADEALAMTNGYFLTISGYESVKAALDDRFGDPQVAIFAHFEALLELKPASHEVESLIQIRDKCEAHIRSLEALGLEENTFGLVFAPIILSKLPRFVKMELHRRNGSKKWTLKALREHLKCEIEAREKSDRAFVTSPKEGASRQPTRDKVGKGSCAKAKEYTGAALVVQGKDQGRPGPGKTGRKLGKGYSCIYCDEKHASWLCEKYPTVELRTKLLGDRCLKCMGKGHKKPDCMSTRTCLFCGKGDHHSSLCYVRQRCRAGEHKGLLVHALNPNASEFAPAVVNAVQGTNNATGEPRGKAVLESARVTVKGQKGLATARVVFDTGSTLSFVRKGLCDQIGAKSVGRATTLVGRFGDAESKQMRFPVKLLRVVLTDGTDLELRLRELTNVSAPIQLIPLAAGLLPADIERAELAEMLVNEPTAAEIDLLLGVDYYYDIVGPEQWRGKNGLVVKQTAVGKILTGFLKEQDVTRAACDRTQLLVVEQARDTSRLFDLERFWRLEDIGIKDPPGLNDDEVALEHFKSTARIRGGRYEVKWPFKTEKPDLPTNREVALRRLKSVHRKLMKEPKLAEDYDRIFQDQLAQGIIEPAPEFPQGLEHYLPHHAVVTPGKETTKVRVVFDASSKATPNASSLNDVMYRGPVFLNDMVGILLRFRLPNVAIVSDVEKAFLQISLQVEHRDCTRFLWLKDLRKPPTDDNLVVFRYARVAFGMKASPFLLGATIVDHMSKTGTKTAIEVKDNTYMDNNIGGRANTSNALRFYKEAKALFREISMNLREWYSNDRAFIAKLPYEDQGKSPCPSVLGIKWKTAEDRIHCTSAKMPADVIGVTKRTILKFLASTFDPCGWFTGVTTQGKILMQDLWQGKKSWDEVVDADTKQRWQAIQRDIAEITTVELPRQVQMPNGAKLDHQLHVFCDASSRAYAAAVYLRTVGKSSTACNLIFAKSRVAPVKALTIPKLELMAAILGVRALNFVAQELKLDLSAKALWTDSTCVLGWLTRDKVNVVFVENRLREIRNSPEIAFGHVKTEENPADMPSRGVDLETVKTSELWWQGPAWLQQNKAQWPKRTATFVPKIAPEPPELVARTEASTTAESDSLVDIQRYSTLTKLLRVTAWVIRASERMRTNREQPAALSANELKRALLFWERRVQEQVFSEAPEKSSTAWRNKVKQLGLFQDDNGFLRCKGRYASAGLTTDTQNPKLLPDKHPFTTLVISCCHARAMHTGLKGTLAMLRQHYWVPDGRRAVKRVIQSCQICRKHFGGPFRSPDEPPLPDFRTRLSRPFASVGLDYIGPLFVRVEAQSERAKVWVALFTCATTRAIHLEMVSSMTAQDFLLCLRRFMALYGTPGLIVSDNAKQFKTSCQVLDRLWQDAQQDRETQDFAAVHGISWKFISEKAPWFGGFYERLVGLVKHALKASLGKWTLTHTELQTLLYEVAFVLNGRPLTYSDDDPADFVLTPAHLLFRARDMFPEVTGEIDPDEHLRTADALIAHWKAGQNLLREFWDVWKNQYLLALRESWRPKRERGVSNLPAEPGCVVLIKEQLPRGRWRVGRISKVRKSGDGKDIFVIDVPANHPLHFNHCYAEPLRLMDKQITSIMQGYYYVMLIQHGKPTEAEKLIEDVGLKWSSDRQGSFMGRWIPQPNVNFLVKIESVLEAIVFHQLTQPKGRNPFTEAFDAELMKAESPVDTAYEFRVYTKTNADLVLTSGQKWGEPAAEIEGTDVWGKVLKKASRMLMGRIKFANPLPIITEFLENPHLFFPVLKKSLLLAADSQAKKLYNVKAGDVVSLGGGRYADAVNVLKHYNLSEYKWVVVYTGTNCVPRRGYPEEQRDKEWAELRDILVNEAAKRDTPTVLFCCSFEQPATRSNSAQSALIEHELQETAVVCINWSSIGNPFLTSQGRPIEKYFSFVPNRNNPAAPPKMDIHINTLGVKVLWNELCNHLIDLRYMPFTTSEKGVSIPRAIFQPPPEAAKASDPPADDPNEPGPSGLQVTTNGVRSEVRVVPKRDPQRSDRKRRGDEKEYRPHKRRYDDRWRRY